MESQQEEAEQAKKACVLCGNEFSGKLSVCPDDGTLLTPIGKEPKVGDIVADRYEILGVLGDGGMGKVYKARHNLMKRIVAVKMLLPHLVQSGPALKRFQQEAQAASALKHPHIMTVHDFGISDKGLPFLVMDYLEGMSLSSLLQDIANVPQERAVNIFIQACSALSHAHKNGVVHRDLKPANLMLIDFDGQPDFLMVVDFGIAKLLQPDGLVEQLTHTGEVFGSPLYMSPEQCRGKELDPRSDIYSLGCVLYRTVTGRPVFGGRDAMECMFKQVNDLPGAFSDVCPELRLSEKLEAAVFKAIAKEPEHRFQTMAEFREALELIEGPATPLPRVFAVPRHSGQEVAYDATTDRMHRPSMKPEDLAAIIGIKTAPESQSEVQPTVPASPPGLSSSPQQSLSSSSQPTMTFPQGETGESSQSGSSSALQPISPSSGEDSNSGSGSSAALFHAPETGTSDIKTVPPAPSTVMNSSAGSITLSANTLTSGAPVLGQAIQQQNSQKPSLDESGSVLGLANSPGSVQSGQRNRALMGGGILLISLIAGILAIVSMNGQHGQSSSSLSSSIADKTKTDGEKGSPAGLHLSEAKSLIASSNYQNAEKTLNKAVDIAGNDRELAELLPLQARVYEQSGKYAQAEAAWAKLLSIQEKTGASQPNIARTKSQLALPILEQGNVDKAEPLLTDAEKTLSNAPESDRLGLAQVYYGLSKVALARGDYIKATDTLQEAINRRTSAEGASDPELVQFWQDLAEVYLVQGKLVDSEVSLNKMLRLAEEKFGKNSAQVADAYKDLGTLYFQKGQLGKAEAYFKKSLAIKTADFGEDSVSAAEVMATLAMLYTREKKYKLAEPLFKRSLDIRTRELGADSKQAKRSRDLYATLQKLMKGSR